jgi:hypothetical protein
MAMQTKALTLALVATTLAVLPPLAADDSVRRYGQGSPGSGNIAPTIWVNSVPRPGDLLFRVRVERALGGTWAFPFFGPREDDITVAGLRFLLDMRNASYAGAFFLSGTGNGGGSGHIPFPLPNNVGLVGQPVLLQAFTLDDFAPNPFGIAATSGLRLLPQLPGQLLVARALPGAPDPQNVIQLAPNRVLPFDEQRFVQGRAVAFAQYGAIALALDPGAARLRVFDADGATPTWRTDLLLNTNGVAEHVVVTPDETRAYVVHRGAAGTQPPALALDVRATASFGMAWPGGPIQLVGTHDPTALVFTADSDTAFLAARGDGTLPSSVSRIDTGPGSPTFHRQLARLEFPNHQVTCLALAPDGSTLYAPLTAAGRPGELALIDVATFTLIDVDQGAPGVQNLGGERSRPRTPLPDALHCIAVDPRGEEVFLGTLGAIVRVHVAVASPLLGRVASTTDDIPPGDAVSNVVVSGAGDFVYATTSQRVIEVDTVRLWSMRSWPVTGAVGLAFR